MKNPKYKNLCYFFILAVFLGYTSYVFGKAPNTNLSYRNLQYKGLERSYYLHLPASYKSAINLPVVFVLHGGGKADGDETAKRTGYNKLADKNGFIVVYPNGINAQWNDGRGKTYRNSANTDIDDVGFISVLIDKIIQNHKVDPSRVYITGLSNGGMMTHRLGCELSSKLAAIAPVIANMPQNIVGQCRPDSPLPMLLMNGTKDPLVPWEGGHVRFFRKKMGKVISTQETIEFWVKHNHCVTVPTIRNLTNKDKKDRSKVKVITYAKRTNQCEVVLYEIQGGGHTFPGSNTRELPLILGRKNNDIDGAEVIWKFFRRHSR